MITFKRYLQEGENYRDDLEGYVRSDYRYSYAAGISKNFGYYVKQYPFKGGTLYRGLNFDSPSKYLAFMRSTRNGYYKSDNISSWGKTYSDGQEFAISPKVYTLNSYVASIYDSQERVSGFIGVVVEIQVGPNIGIDVNASPYSAESEVILPSGNYKIKEVHTEKKWKHILRRADINQEFLDHLNKRGGEDWDKIRALLRYKREDLLPEVIDRVMNRALDNITKHVSVKTKLIKPSKWSTEDKSVTKVANLIAKDGVYETDIYIGMGLAGYFNDKEVQEYIKRNPRRFADGRKKAINKINQAFAPISKQNVFVNFGSGYTWLGLRDALNIGPNDIPSVKRIMSNSYDRLNTEGSKLVNKGEISGNEFAATMMYILKGPFGT